jgi:hypothetical protein
MYYIWIKHAPPLLQQQKQQFITADQQTVVKFEFTIANRFAALNLARTLL